MSVDRECLHDGLCACGKLKFISVALARKYDHKMRIYLCSISSSYHLTTKSKWDNSRPQQSVTKFNIRRLQRELNEQVATMQEQIVNFMKGRYTSHKQYKFSASEVIDAVLKKNSMWQRGSVSAQISTMKAKGIIVSTDEPVPGARSDSKYFGLAEILEEVTKPEPVKPKTVIKEEPKPVTKESPVSAKLPSQASPTNPFDKVNSQLGELLQKVNGLLNGYTQVVEDNKNQRIALQSIAAYDAPQNSVILEGLHAINTKLESSEINLDDADLASFAGKVINQMIDPEGNYIGAMRALNTGIVARQSSVLRDSIIARLENTTEDIAKFVAKLNVTTPANVSNSDDYKAGITEGIRLAVEMGLRMD